MTIEAASSRLTRIAQSARRAYVETVTGATPRAPWWTVVIITASSARQGERYESELQRRREAGKLPPDALYLVVPDLDDARIGSGGATLNALTALAKNSLAGSSVSSLEEWWLHQRVLVIHSGGDSRRLPEYSLSGKLFSALPIKTPWGEVSTVFDEMLALSTAWVAQLASGLVVSSGDVVLTFDAGQLEWNRPGVCGVAMREPVEVGSGHGVYVIGDHGRVYSFLQKPSAAQVRAAGGLLDGDSVALDVGLLRFDVPISARLTELAGAVRIDGHWRVGDGILVAVDRQLPVIDLYEHMTLALTGEWEPGRDADPAHVAVADALGKGPFWCSLVDGEFTHVGTTSHFRRLMTEDTRFSRLYTAQQRLGAVSPPGVTSAGVIVDSVFGGGGEIGAGSVVIESEFSGAVRAGRSSILHGLSGMPAAVVVPDEMVVHQVPVRLDDGQTGVVIRVYGVQDDPKPVVSSGQCTWFGRPMFDVIEELELDPGQVWPDVPPAERCLWNARLFVFGSVETAWKCARWLMRLPARFSPDQWSSSERLSLASSALLADGRALADARGRRLQAGWKLTAVALARSGADVRPLLARSPGTTALKDTGRTLQADGVGLEATSLTEAASRYYQAGLFLGQAGLERDADQARADAFRCVQDAVERGSEIGEPLSPSGWAWNRVRVTGPARLDLGGGWSDTPPFCLDWGGTVLNLAVTLDGKYPITVTVERIDEPLIRCISVETNEITELRSTDDIIGPLAPGSVVAIPRAALRLIGITPTDVPLARRLASLGGGLEIRSHVDLPMGSGLGTSSILAATLLRALAQMSGIELSDLSLSNHVLRLEQLMTTGGGWQDQAGGIFPGAKLITTGPGLVQRLRVQPLAWSAQRQHELNNRFVLYYTGIRRIAKNLLAQVVGSYLAREVATLQVLHSIKTLAVEMSYAMSEGEWDLLGDLIARHWRLNQILDPHTTNAPIDSLLDELAPHLAGAKLAGAGGGGFLMLLAKSEDEARAMRAKLNRSANNYAGMVRDYEIVNQGLRVESD